MTRATTGRLLRPIYVLAIACITWSPHLAATTYPPITFDELVTRADVIFVGDVVDVRPFVTSFRGQQVVKTRVVFSVRDPLWGTSSSLEVLEFLGGEVGDLQLVVAESPRFVVGERRVVFAYKRGSINPIVGFTQGAMRVQPDSAGVERVLTLDRAPISNVEQLGRPRSLSVGSAMSLPDLRARVVSTLQERRK